MFAPNVLLRRMAMCMRTSAGGAVRAFAQVTNAKTRIGILGMPLNKGQRKSGVSLGPKAIREGGLESDIKEFNGI